MSPQQHYDSETFKALLMDREGMRVLCDMFIKGSMEIVKEQEWAKKRTDDLIDLHEQMFKLTAIRAINAIFKYSESPIETIFLNSLILGAIHNYQWIFIHQTCDDAIKEINEFRKYFLNFRELMLRFEKNTREKGLNLYNHLESNLNQKLTEGIIGEEEKEFSIEMAAKYHFFPTESNFHLTLQPNLYFEKEEKKITYRPDLYLWDINNPNLQIVVECDGFQYHSSHKSFNNDRKKDRIFQENGFRILRYSGSEINKNPIATSSDLLKHLWGIKEKALKQ